MPIMTIPLATSGINRYQSPTVPGSYSPYMVNMLCSPGSLRKHLGYSLLGSNLPLTGTGMELIRYIDARGNKILIALTTSNAYRYNSSSDEWDEITPEAADFSGADTAQWSWCVARDADMFTNNGGDALIISNNTDDLYYFEGQDGDKFQALVHTIPSFAHCKCLEEFRNHFMVLNYNDSNNNVRSLYAAGVGDIDDYTTDSSVNVELTDSHGAILRASKIGSNLAIYSEGAITECAYVGTPSIFSFDTLVHRVGLLTQRSIAFLRRAHFLLGSDNQVYVYFGGTQIEKIGDPVAELLFDLLDVTKMNYIVAGHYVNNKRIVFAIPAAGDSYAQWLFVYNYDHPEKPWELLRFSHDVRGLATFDSQYTWYCDDTDWTDVYADETTVYCDASAGQTSYDVTCFLTSDGYIYKLDEALGKHGSLSISCEYQTYDLTVDQEEHFGRWSWFSFTAKSDIASSTVYVYYSTDQGETWTQLVDSPVSLNNEWTTHRLPMDVLSRVVRIKMYQGAGDFQLRSNLRVKVVPQPERD